MYLCLVILALRKLFLPKLVFYHLKFIKASKILNEALNYEDIRSLHKWYDVL